MDINNLKGLMEAYQQVNAPQEVDEATAMAKRGYDEAPIRQKIAKSTGGQAADRATKLADKPTFGNDKAAKQRQDLARKQRGDFRSTTSSSPGLHGYAHKSDDPKVKAKQAARGAQRGALTPAEKKQFNREELDLFDTILEFLCVEGFAETLEEAEWMMANVIDEEAIEIVVGEGYDIFDVVLEFLQAEGYAETLEEAEWMMANMIDEEAIEIVLGEAQAARNNPEKYEREQSKKYAPVRGERTPMPPRGDKRREDFEKWYAKQMGR